MFLWEIFNFGVDTDSDQFQTRAGTISTPAPSNGLKVHDFSLA